MSDNFDVYPKKHILPYDGMSITANVWNEAHQFHTQNQNAHQYLLHGYGIVSGLEVIASDPPGSVIYILPGVAVDNAGKMIVLSEPVAYDLGSKIDGKLYLMLVHREVKVKQEGSSEDSAGNVPAYLQSEFVIVARPDILDAPHVEIARVTRETGTTPVKDAVDSFSPGINAIDLRYRKTIPLPVQEHARIGVVYFDIPVEGKFEQALVNLVKPIAAATPYQMIVENDIPVDQNIFNFNLLYLIVGNVLNLGKAEIDLLQSYLQNDGKILVEIFGADSEKVISDIGNSLGIKLAKLPEAHPVYQQPNLFYNLPVAGKTQEKAGCWYGESGVFCTNSYYGLIWSKQKKNPGFNRSIIRDTIEWGVNLFNYLLSE